MTRILALDPGGTTGYAMIEVIDDQIKFTDQLGETKDQTLVDIIPVIRDADIIIYEDFRIRPSNARAGKFDWQNVTAERVIGSLLTICKQHGKQVVEKQQPNVRVPGYGFARLQYSPGKRGQHMQDAVAHAVYYAVRKLGAAPVPEPS